MTPAATLPLGDGLDLPAASAASQVYAFMGRRGSGKTYGAGRLVELLLDFGGQVVVIDPVGNWWGLRFLADGKTPSGYEIPVFGGAHGDLPLPATAGKVFAEMAATRSTSMVLDVSEMTGAEQRKFVGEFALELFHAKKRNRSPLTVVFEEAQEFVPQMVRPDHAKMVGACEKLIKLGRNYTVGAVLISQRPQAVNKDVLNQAEVLLAFQLTGPQERKAIAGWVQETGAGDREIANDLPSLKPGTAMVWSPQWLGSFGKYKIGKKKTLDASATSVGRADEHRKLPPIDLNELRSALAAAETEIAENDVDALKAEVRRLTAAVAHENTHAVGVSHQWIQRVRELESELAAKPRVPPEVFARVDSMQERIGEMLDVVRGVLEDFANLQSDMKARRSRAPLELADPVAVPRASNGVRTKTVAHERFTNNTDLKLGALRLLTVLKERHPELLPPGVLATLALMTKSGGTFSTYMGKLVGEGYAYRDGGSIGLTEKGLATPSPPMMSKREIVEHWKGEVKGKAKDVLETLALEHEATVAELCERFDMTKSGGTWSTYRGRLVGLGLIQPAGGGKLRIHPELAL
jgi:hypothetical protein